jgi:hypothetical protein
MDHIKILRCYLMKVFLSKQYQRYMYIKLIYFQQRSEADVLKILSSEMDPIEIGLIRNIFIKGSVAAGF